MQTHYPGFSWSSFRLLPPPIWIPLIAVLLTSIGVAVFSEWSARRARLTGIEVAEVLHRLDALADLRTLLVDVETAQRGYLLTRDPVYLEPYAQAVKEITPAARLVRQLSQHHRDVQAGLETTSDLIARIIARARETVELHNAGRTEEALTLLRDPQSRRLMQDFRTEVQTMEKLSQAQLADLRDTQTRTAVWSRASLIFITLVSLGLLVIVARLFIAEAVRQHQRRTAAEQEAKELEKLVEERTRELSALSTHLQEFAEKEKSELAHNLHDELGGLLTAAKMDLSWIQSRVDQPAVQQRLQQLGSVLDDAMGVKRRVVEDLRPSLLDHFGLPTALRAYFESVCSKAGVNCEISVAENEVVPKDVAIALFRVVQEGLTNAVRHAQASTIRLDFEVKSGSYVLRVRDDGKGIDLRDARVRWSHGLSGMRHRVKALGGGLRIESEPGQGTTIHVEVPRRAA
jgi:signal transduction histidine kinase